ncbi:glycosyltransferase [Ktedonobacter racemifer]|uniref:Glycosyl transferase group 1 n=1 Tax=Ktedonobacter racemifer DSM 44963 TaxID=485913 RepID=D6TLU6_KTERA|nr:glycosyltransferase [Ktedonobacter racemifer]EFH86746.1 glycosyl transferase group 1 [Ktedonobacter racemifer DSM 44963]
MKILIISSYLPAPQWGASARSYYLLHALAEYHEVCLLALASPEEVQISAQLPLVQELNGRVTLLPFQPGGAKRRQQIETLLRGKSYWLEACILPEVQDAIDALYVQEPFDAVLYEGLFVAGYRLPPGVKIVLDQHNIEQELLWRTYQNEKEPVRKIYNWLEYRVLKRGELERCQQADLVLTTSGREQEWLQTRLSGQQIAVVPNGVDLERFQVDPARQEQAGRIIFTGTMDYYPNSTAVLAFARDYWPYIRRQIPGATWQIVGRKPPPEVERLGALPGVVVTGSVPDTRPYLAEAEVAIVPLSVGSGTRLKILEALAMQKAVVSTSIGCEGLELEANTHLLVADEPGAFVEAVVSLLRDAEKRARLGSAGRALVEQRYGWGYCGELLTRAVSVLTGDTVSSPVGTSFSASEGD